MTMGGVLSEGLTGESSAAKLSHKVVGRDSVPWEFLD